MYIWFNEHGHLHVTTLNDRTNEMRSKQFLANNGKKVQYLMITIFVFVKKIQVAFLNPNLLHCRQRFDFPFTQPLLNRP